MDNSTSSPTDTVHRALTPAEARHELQAILGQLHGLLSKAIEQRTEWCPKDLLDSLASAYRDIGQAFGAVQAELNTGDHDSKLKDLGLDGAQMEPKKKGFWQSLQQFFSTKGRGPAMSNALGSATRWGGIMVGSLSREIPGGEVIKECLEVIEAALEDHSESLEQSQTSLKEEI